MVQQLLLGSQNPKDMVQCFSLPDSKDGQRFLSQSICSWPSTEVYCAVGFATAVVYKLDHGVGHKGAQNWL